jgi:phosphate transport system protein
VSRAARPHSDRAFEQELRDLREKLLAMGGRVEEQLCRAVEALVDRDVGLANAVRAADADVDRLEVEVDALCHRMLALRHPAACDLRSVTTALKLVTDLERMGDLAVHIARSAVELSDLPPLRPLGDLSELAALARAQLQWALDAYVRGDVALAQAVLRKEALVDAAFSRLFDSLLELMTADPRNIRRGYALMSVCRHLERVGDHARNVAERVVFLVRGEDPRRPPADPPPP